MITISNLSCAINHTPILSDISFDAHAGEVIGIIGPNGAGKSTLLRSLAGLVEPCAGAITLGGVPLCEHSLSTRAKTIGYLPQSRPVYWNLKAQDVVALGRLAFGQAEKLDEADQRAVDQAMADAQVEHLRKREVHTLSGGEKARVHLARLLAGGAQILLADEPTAALDPAHQIHALEILRNHATNQSNQLTIVAIHDLALAALFCTRLIALKNGKLVTDGPPRGVITAEHLKEIFDISADIEWHAERVAILPKLVR